MNTTHRDERPIRLYRPTYDGSAGVDDYVVSGIRDIVYQRLSTYLKLIPLNGSVLDVGCGRQPFRKMIEETGCRYYAQDAVQNIEKSVNFICFIDGELSIALRDAGPFDLILCTEVLEHVADWKSAFANLASLLRPGGALLITCPFFYPLHEEPFDFSRPTVHGIRYHAEAASLVVTECVQSGTPWAVLATLIGHLNIQPASNRFKTRIAYAVIRRVLNRLVLWIRKGMIARHCVSDCKVYLTNVAILTKSAGNGT